MIDDSGMSRLVTLVRGPGVLDFSGGRLNQQPFLKKSPS
jgi:hypothetical protein